MDTATSAAKPIIQTRLTVEHWDWGFAIGFDFCNTEGKPNREWWGVAITNEDSPDAVADNLDLLANAIREKIGCRHDEMNRTMHEINAAEFQDRERNWPERP